MPRAQRAGRGGACRAWHLLPGLALALLAGFAAACETLPARPEPPADAADVTRCPSAACATPDDDLDDTTALQAALDAAPPGSWLKFPPGRYLIRHSLRIRTAGLTLWGHGAELHATNPDDQALIVEANDVSIHGYTLTARTAARMHTAEHARIAVYPPPQRRPVRNVVIRDNRIVASGPPGTALANAGSSAGILVAYADGFLVAGNTVERTLADGIHVTGGSRNGRILENTVRETGDDMIALVSYAYADGPGATGAARMNETLHLRSEAELVRNVLVARNRLSGPYWGRGIALVGAADVTVRANELHNLPYAAAILLARETSYGTFGVRNVVIEDNRIGEVQTLAPAYDFAGKFAAHPRTGHGAIEVHAARFEDEAPYPALAEAFAVRDIVIRGNLVDGSATPAVRIGATAAERGRFGGRASRGDGGLGAISVRHNRLLHLRDAEGVSVASPWRGVVDCGDNLLDAGAPPPHCSTPAPAAAVSGASLDCRTKRTPGSS